MPSKPTKSKTKKTSKTAKKAPAAAPKNQKRLRILYKGRVQGVGFRYTAERIALDIGVTGWVRNLPDGDVELVAEGAPADLTRLVEGIQASQVGPHIKKTQLDWRDGTGEFSDFRIEFVY